MTGAVNIHLTLDKTISTEEGYTLQTDPPSKEIHITGKTDTGVFYGIQTLLSLLFDKSDLPKVLIKDEPRFGFRGMYVDISRNFHSKNTLLKLIDAMAMYKLNKFHIHLADDEGWRIEIKDLPELTEVYDRVFFCEIKHFFILYIAISICILHWHFITGITTAAGYSCYSSISVINTFFSLCHWRSEKVLLFPLTFLKEK